MSRLDSHVGPSEDRSRTAETHESASPAARPAPAGPPAEGPAEDGGGARDGSPSDGTSSGAWAAHLTDPLVSLMMDDLGVGGPGTVPERPGSGVYGGASSTGAAGGPTRPAPAEQARPALKQGARGEQVRELQEGLNNYRVGLGLRPIDEDGEFGAGTRRALAQFQAAHGLTGDGVAGAKTWEKLLGTGSSTQAPEPRAGSTTAKVLGHRDAIEAAAEKRGVPAALIAAIMEAESGGEAGVIGQAGPTRDVGLMQINPRAHPKYFKDNPDPTDPARNTSYGTAVLADALRAFDGDVERAIAAYNAGANGVRKAIREGRDVRTATFHDNYVDKVLKLSQKYAAYF